jgi:hypothetical protein
MHKLARHSLLSYFFPNFALLLHVSVEYLLRRQQKWLLRCHHPDTLAFASAIGNDLALPEFRADDRVERRVSKKKRYVQYLHCSGFLFLCRILLSKRCSDKPLSPR